MVVVAGLLALLVFTGPAAQADTTTDLSITKSGSPASLPLGTGNITWTMTITNNGPTTDTGVTVTDAIPAGNAYVSSTITQGTCTGGAILSCSIGTMGVGATVTITLVTTPSSVGLVTNTATVVGDLTETNTANNTATATVRVVSVAPTMTSQCMNGGWKNFVIVFKNQGACVSYVANLGGQNPQ